MANSSDILYKRIGDMFLSAHKRQCPVYTPFLDKSEATVATQSIKSIGKLYPKLGYQFWGGFESAERQILCVHSIYIEPIPEKFPIKIIQFDYNDNFSKLSHRDFLGAIMALNVTRDAVGDIVVGNGKTQVVVSATIADVIWSEVTRIGSVGVTSTIVDAVTIEVKQQSKEICNTVPSLRLDCIVGTALNVSRSRAQQIVRSGTVTINYVEQSSVDYTVYVGDRFAIKGFGMYLLDAVSEPTKKNRFHIIIKKYL